MADDRLTIRLGPLAKPLAAAAKESGKSITLEVRARLAASLGLPEPDMPTGKTRLTKRERIERARNASAAVSPESAVKRARKAWKTKRANAKAEESEG
jgi:hypothetical protein